MLILYEIKKIFSSKSLLPLIAVGLCLYAIFFLYSAMNDEKLSSYDELDAAFDMYSADPENAEKAYEFSRYLKDEYQEKELAEMMLGNVDYVSPPLPATLFESQMISDYELLGYVFDYKRMTEDFSSDIEEVIREARIQYEISKESFTEKYEKSLISVYEKLKNVSFEFEHIRGFDVYFAGKSDEFLVLAIILLLSGALFGSDDTSLLIITPCRKGGKHTALAKSGALVICTVVTVFAVFAVNILLITFTYGFSSFSNSVHAIEELRYCPFDFDMAELMAVDLGCKIVFFICISLAFYALYCILRSKMLSFAVSASVMLVCFISSRYTDHVFSTFASLNPFFVTDTYVHFGKYNVFSLFGYCTEQFSTSLLVYVVIGALSILLSVFLYPCRTLSFGKKKKVLNPFGKNLILTYELKKLFTKANILSLVLLAILFVFTVSAARSVPDSYTDNAYLEYMKCLEGERTKEKADYIVELVMSSDDILSKRDEYAEKYERNEMSEDEYRKYRRLLSEAMANRRALEKVVSLDTYLETKEDACYVYDEGYRTVLEFDFLWIEALAVIIVCSGVFANEYKNDSSKILGSTKNGTSRLFSIKIFACLIVSLLVFSSFSFISIYLLTKGNYFPDSSFEISNFIGFDYGFSIRAYLALKYASELIYLFVCGIVTSLISHLSKHLIITAISSTILLVLPDMIKRALALYISPHARVIVCGTILFCLFAVILIYVKKIVCR